MCSLDKHSPAQCKRLNYDYCCDVGTPCDCSKGPQANKLDCYIVDKACELVFHSAVTSITGCVLSDATVVAACEAAGLGPADPLADACAAILATTVTVACEAAIKAGGKFVASECKKAAGCPSAELVV